MDKDLDAILDIPLGRMGIESLLPRDLGIGMIVFLFIIFYNDRECTADYLFVDHSNNLSFGENFN